MLDQEVHDAGLSGVVAAPDYAAPDDYVAVMGSLCGGRNTHLCTIGEESAVAEGAAG
jgi:hypothetical protein